MGLRILSLALTSVLPIWGVRKFIYSFFFKYKFTKTGYVGLLCVLDCEIAEISGSVGYLNLISCDVLVLSPGAKIGSYNHISRLARLSLGASAWILHRNRIAGPKARSRFGLPTSTLELGAGAQLSSRFLIDVCAPVKVGCDTVLGGEGSQIWTHAFDTDRQFTSGQVTIGDKCFLGSQVIITPGVSIGSRVIVAPGSVVYKDLSNDTRWTTHALKPF